MTNSVPKQDNCASSKPGKALKFSNIHLQSSKASALHIRSIASSTAIGTGGSIAAIESKLQKMSPQTYRVKLR